MHPRVGLSFKIARHRRQVSTVESEPVAGEMLGWVLHGGGKIQLRVASGQVRFYS
jgi:hypothetical protein